MFGNEWTSYSVDYKQLNKVLIFCLIVAIISFSIFVIMDIFGGKYILDIEDLPMNCDTVIILGAGVRADGNPCDLLADRLDTGAKLYVMRICKTILLKVKIKLGQMLI